jgi:Skp family chaperone for outer membrane proteins
METFIKLGVDPDQYTGLIEVCKKVDDPGFINAALKLNRIEAEGQMSYEEATSKFGRITSELPPAENRLRGLQTKLKSLNRLIAQRNSELTNVEAYVVQLQKEAKAKEAKLEQEFGIKMKKLNVQDKEVEAVAKLKTELIKQGLDLPTLLKLATEFK